MVAHQFPATPDPANKRLVVLVHGFGSSKQCWVPLLELFQADPSVTAACDFGCFEYPTAWANTRFVRRIPRLLEIARSLGTFLELRELAAYSEIVLVGHSQGGLVIQSYLADKLNRGKTEDLRPIRQVIMIATPSLGSTLLSPLRKFFSLFFANPQERALRVLDPEIAEVRATITERIVGATEHDPAAWPISVQCFWGTQDRVVLEASARGSFDTDLAAPLHGDHFTILRPASRDHENYKAIAEALLEPAGHRCVFEIDAFDIRIAVAPVSEERQDFAFTHAGKPVRIHTDNVAQVDRTVTFSKKNRCTDAYTLRYTTMSDGYLTATMSHPNEASPSESAGFEARGSSVAFGFHPRKSEAYRLLVEVYKGFDEGQRNVHFHLVPHGRKAYYKRIRVTLDLSAYLRDGWAVTDLPKLYHFDRDQPHSERCSQQRLSTPRPSEPSSTPGVWTWELHRVREGLVDVVWDVALAVPHD